MSDLAGSLGCTQMAGSSAASPSFGTGWVSPAAAGVMTGPPPPDRFDSFPPRPGATRLRSIVAITMPAAANANLVPRWVMPVTRIVHANRPLVVRFLDLCPCVEETSPTLVRRANTDSKRRRRPPHARQLRSRPQAQVHLRPLDGRKRRPRPLRRAHARAAVGPADL